jgi:hypothetical protein
VLVPLRVPLTASPPPLSRFEAVEPTLLATPDPVDPTGAGSVLATVDTAPVACETPLATVWTVLDTVPATELGDVVVCWVVGELVALVELAV